MAFVATDPNQVVVSFDGGETVLYDLTTEQSTTALETQTKDGMFWSKCVTAAFPSSEIADIQRIPCPLYRQRADQPCGQPPV